MSRTEEMASMGTPGAQATRPGGRGHLYVLSGPSGVGKDTLLNELLAGDPLIRKSVSSTTRPPRPGEREGIDYHFVAPERFDAMVAAEAFLEWKEVHGNRYGTPRHPVETMLAGGFDVILKIDVAGASEVRRLFDGGAVYIFLAPPSVELLEQRLRGRRDLTEEQIQRRLADARWELAQQPLYDHVVVNEEQQAERAVHALQAVIAAGRAPASSDADDRG